MIFDIETYVQDNLDHVKTSASGELNATCPFCGKDQHFYINAETGKFICFKCDERGRNPIGLIAHIEGITYGEAMRIMMKQAVAFKRRKETPESLLERVMALRGADAEADEVDFDLPSEFRPVFKNGKWRFPAYLKDRRIARATAHQWGIGWCSDGRYAGRIIIPIECPNGRSFTARDTTGEQEPRYLNPTGADHGRLLLGWEHAPVNGDIALVEGPLDAIKMWQHGIPSLAVMGHFLHSEQLGLLFKKPQEATITVMLDPEETTTPYDMASQLTCRFDNVYIARLSDGVDPGDSTKKQALTAYENAAKYDGNRVGALNAVVAASRKKLSERYQ